MNLFAMMDTSGGAMQAAITYTQTATNTWSYSVALPAADFLNGVSVPVSYTHLDVYKRQAPGNEPDRIV